MNNEKQVILVVDDTPENIDILSGVLGDSYKVKAALNGKRALKIAESESPPDLILLDVMMPEIDGYEVCTRLKSNPSTQNIPVIFVTAKTESQDETKGLELGAVDYITKPISPSIVKARVSTQLALHRTQVHLEHARELAEKADKAKSEFLASMSHEIRTPLNGLVANLELLELSEISEEQQKMIHSSKFCADTLLAIIGDILDFSKIEAGMLELDLHSMDVRSMLKNIHSMILPRAVQKEIDLHLFIAPDTPNEVISDSIRIRQVIVNLIGNAIKFTEHGGVLLYVSTEFNHQNQSMLRFDVIDSGVGFSPEKAEQLFEAFTQEEQSTTRKFGGTGLGLAISKRIVEIMHGKIGCAGSPNYGAHFYFEIPVDVQEPSQSIQYEYLKENHVIIVHDEESDPSELIKKLNSYNVNTHSIVLDNLKEGNLRITSPFNSDRDCMIAMTNRPEHIAWHPLIHANRPRRWLLLSNSKSPNCQHEALRQGFGCFQIGEINWDDVFQYILSVGTQSEGVPSKSSLSDQLTNTINEIAQKNITNPILVIDDFEMNRNVAIKQLKTFGLTCETAVNGKDGLDKAKENDYSLIFVDWMMPVMDGIEFANQYRLWEKEQGKHVPVIAMTANALKGDEERCLEAGMDNYLSKPVKMEKLAAILSTWLTPENNNTERSQPQDLNRAPEDEKPIESISRPPVDLKYLSEILAEDDPQELAETLDMYKDELDNLLVEISSALKNQDRQAFRDASHKAKGGASYAAAMKLSEIYKDMQLSALDAPWDELHEKFNDANKEWIQVKQFIEQLNQSSEAS